ncbi:MAG: GDP-mannose 4,6-dehydratase, partial [Akkermansiaceae bacterium]
MKILVTGGAGFIGSAIVRQLIQKHEFQVVNIDNLTYAADPARLASVADSNLYTFEKADICNAEELTRIFAQHQPTAVIHAAAETHVDRSIDSSSSFIQTNIVGTHVLLETTR